MTGQFSPAFREELAGLMWWRRDVRRFRIDPVPEDLLARGLQAFTLAPSVGLCEPWRILRVTSTSARTACLSNFRDCNARALDGFDGDRAATYSRLKLTGMAEAPIHLAVFCDDGTEKGHGLGAVTMPETRAYSVVGAITHLWLALRAEGLEVWFDKIELRGGDAWGASIRQKIKECALFVPIISASMPVRNATSIECRSTFWL